MSHGGHGMSHGEHVMHDMAHGDHNMENMPGMSSHSGHQVSPTSHGMAMSMAMTFHGGYTETVLFEWWKTEGVGSFIASFLGIYVIALVYEGLKYYRKHLLWRTYAGLQYCAVAAPLKTNNADDPVIVQPVGHMVERKTPTMLSAPHAWQTFLHGVQVLVSYALMLIFMTYNTWLCLAVVLGSATGYFLFGWRESVVVDFTEHCH